MKFRIEPLDRRPLWPYRHNEIDLTNFVHRKAGAPLS